MHVVGSFDELEELSGVRLEDPHRPYVDEVGFPCPQCSRRMARVPEVIDVWFDSGAMPFAQWHAPFENDERFEAHFPADFICEALDQTRGWFYSLLAVSTLLFDRSSVRARRLPRAAPRRRGPEDVEVQGQHRRALGGHRRFGADAFRWYFFTSKQPWDGYRFSIEAVGEGVRLFLRQLWNTYAFLRTYTPERDGEQTDLDRWILSRLAATVEEVTERLEAYDATVGGRAIAAFVDDLSNWYVRRSRRRFWEGDRAAFETLRAVPGHRGEAARAVHAVHRRRDLREPRRLRAERAPARLAGGGRARPRAGARHGRGARDGAARAGARARGEGQAAPAAARGGRRRRRATSARRSSAWPTSCATSSTSRTLRFVEEADELGSYEVKPNYRTLGPRFGKAMPQVAAAVAALDPAHVAATLRDGGTVGIHIDGHDHELTADDLLLAMAPLEGYQLEREGSHAVALELALTDELRREGLAREVVHAVQSARKAAGLAVEDRIALTLGGDDELLDAARAHEPYLAGETLATRVAFDGAANGQPATIEGRELRIGVAPA